MSSALRKAAAIRRCNASRRAGDKVLTTSGIFATVVSMESDRAVLRISDETKVEFAKSAIAQVLSAESK